MVWYGMVWYGMVWYGNCLFDKIKSTLKYNSKYRVCQKKERHFKYICKVANN